MHELLRGHDLNFLSLAVQVIKSQLGTTGTDVVNASGKFDDFALTLCAFSDDALGSVLVDIV